MEDGLLNIYLALLLTGIAGCVVSVHMAITESRKRVARRLSRRKPERDDRRPARYAAQLRLGTVTVRTSMPRTRSNQSGR